MQINVKLKARFENIYSQSEVKTLNYTNIVNIQNNLMWMCGTFSLSSSQSLYFIILLLGHLISKCFGEIQSNVYRKRICTTRISV